jgi:hypothetical protein
MGSSYDDETQVKKGSEDKTIENSKPKSEPANQDKKKRDTYKPRQSFMNSVNRPSAIR